MKELKDSVNSLMTRVQTTQWNPVKELKVIVLIRRQINGINYVESGEGIERSSPSRRPQAPQDHVESGEGIERINDHTIRPLLDSYVESGEGIESAV